MTMRKRDPCRQTNVCLIAVFAVLHSNGFSLIAHTRREQNNLALFANNNYYDDNDYYEEDPRDYREPPIPRSVNIPKRNLDNNYSPLVPRTPPPSRKRRDDDIDPYYYDEQYDDDDDDEEEDEPQNFWSNPVGAVDAPPPRRRRRRRPSQRSRIPSSKSSVPPALRDFYERLFWYGFGDDDDMSRDSDGDRTVFGGTKGKFNGLSYFQDMKSPEKRRPRDNYYNNDANDETYPPKRDYYEDEDEYLPEVYEEDRLRNDAYDNRPRIETRRRIDDFDEPLRPKVDNYDEPRQPKVDHYREDRPHNNDYSEARPKRSYYDEDEERDWPRSDRRRQASYYEDSQQYYDDGDEEFPRRRSRPRYERQESWNLWDAFLGRRDSDSTKSRERRAEEYDEAMGLKKPRRTPRRPGFTYRYEEEDTIEPPVEVIDAEPVPDTQPANETATLSWEKRVLAVEQIPPAGIPAWGPMGDVGVDARTKAVTDALEDVREIQAIVRDREQSLQQAKEEVSILRVDAGLQQNKLRQRRDLSVEEFDGARRRMDQKVDDAARHARLQELRLKNAQRDLNDIETRHWAILQHFDPGLTSKIVDEAKRETNLAGDGNSLPDSE